MATANSKSAVNLNFSEPPARRGGKGRPSKYLPVLEALRQHPGKFAKLAENVRNTSIATAIKKGTMKGIERGEFTATSRVVEGKEGVFDIYARFNTPEQRAEAEGKVKATASA